MESQLNHPAMFHHIQSFHVKSINDISNKHIRPLWLSAANGGIIHQIECEIDSGAGRNVMPLYLHKSLFGDKELLPNSVQIFGYGESPVANLGACTIAIHTGNSQEPQMATCQGVSYPRQRNGPESRLHCFSSCDSTFLNRYATNSYVNALRPDSSEVNEPTCVELDNVAILNGKRHCLPTTKEYVLAKFKDVFKCIGKLPGGKYHIQLKPDVQPV